MTAMQKHRVDAADALRREAFDLLWANEPLADRMVRAVVGVDSSSPPQGAPNTTEAKKKVPHTA
jgi:hypothetical protein